LTVKIQGKTIFASFNAESKYM